VEKKNKHWACMRRRRRARRCSTGVFRKKRKVQAVPINQGNQVIQYESVRIPGKREEGYSDVVKKPRKGKREEERVA